MIQKSSVKAMNKSLGLPELIVEQSFISHKFKYSKLTLNEDWAGDYTNSIFRAKAITKAIHVFDSLGLIFLSLTAWVWICVSQAE